MRSVSFEAAGGPLLQAEGGSWLLSFCFFLTRGSAILGSSFEGLNPAFAVGLDAFLLTGNRPASQQIIPTFLLSDIQMIKYDVLTKSFLKWEEEHCWPAEPLFVPMPGAKDEDDGKPPGRGAHPLSSTCDLIRTQRPRWGPATPPTATASGVTLWNPGPYEFEATGLGSPQDHTYPWHYLQVWGSSQLSHPTPAPPTSLHPPGEVLDTPFSQHYPWSMANPGNSPQPTHQSLCRGL